MSDDPSQPGGYQPPPGGQQPPQGGYPPPPPGGYPPPPQGGYPPPGGYPQQGAPGYPPQGAPGYPQQGAPDNYLVWAILSTVLCCLPLGIVSIIKSTQVNGLWQQGRYAEAQKSAEDAKKFAMWGAIAGVVVAVLYIIFAVVLGAASFSTY